ncbi:PD-(D/E)XK motif protein [Corallococcus exiguus]|uniref:PD-(D/E)XK motif protein n=1 Tax=Corallococcus exiguus TaxID=83462 RepID=UPI00155F7D5A|nr:PD-(D/E)XK motif protein [Corallococcus exiguus]NRD48802.1 PD-(D/E)XK motif protein [Corallococcus exiguus]
MGAERHLTWENFRDTFIGPGVPAIHPVCYRDRADIQIFVDGGARRVGMYIPLSTKRPQIHSPLAAIGIRTLVIAGREMLELSTQQSGLYQQFYALMVDVADRVQAGGLEPSLAVGEALSDWKELLREVPLLSIEAQTGLFGELWVLERLRRHHGPAAVDGWVGPTGEPHDFRVGDYEFEVKTTRMLEQIHVISGLNQLVPSSGRRLYVVSIKIAPAGHGAGESLPECVLRLKHSLGVDAARLGQFIHALSVVGYKDADASRYPGRMILRAPIVLIPVDEACPRLTPDSLRCGMAPRFADRISDVRYRLDLSGLGFSDGTPEFEALLPL